MPRIARVVAVGLPHHVTQRGNNRGQVFFSDDDRRFYLWKLAQYCRKYGFSVWAYCLMDNHVHFLGVPEREESLARCFGGTNLVHTQRVNRVHHRSGRLWQNRFFSCPVDRDGYLLPVLRYIERNPVRAGLVKKAWDHVWSSARSHVIGTVDPLLNPPDWLAEQLKSSDYKKYLRQSSQQEEDEVRSRTATGRPLGGTRFTAVMESRLGRVLTARRAGRPRKKDRKK
jgi:putative transposase